MIIGISGHQSLKKDIIKWLKKNIELELKKSNANKGYSSLAIGADQIFANILLENHIPLVAIIPSENYIETFDKIHHAKYLKILDNAESKIELSFEEPTENAFYRAGKVIAEKSDILFAVWDGYPAKGLGGTADIVKYMMSLNKKIIHFDITTKSIKYIN